MNLHVAFATYCHESHPCRSVCSSVCFIVALSESQIVANRTRSELVQEIRDVWQERQSYACVGLTRKTECDTLCSIVQVFGWGSEKVQLSCSPTP